MKKRIIILLLSALLITNLNIFTHAASNNDYVISPLWENISNVDGTLYINGKNSNFSAFIFGNTDVTRITATAKLYYQNTSNQWIEISKNWNYSVNSSFLAIDEDFIASSGTTYKVVLEADVYANGYTESITKEIT